jgi:hypothetical protein
MEAKCGVGRGHVIIDRDEYNNAIANDKVLEHLSKDAEGVHCVPGDRRWAWTHPGGGVAAVLLGTVFWSPGGEPDWRIGFGTAAHPVAVDTGYSTQAAAESLKE